MNRNIYNAFLEYRVKLQGVQRYLADPTEFIFWNPDMSLEAELTKEQQKALEENDGFIEGFSYVIMTKEVYRQTMGIGTEEELAASIKAIEQGLADVEAGRVRPFQEFISEMRND